MTTYRSARFFRFTSTLVASLVILASPFAARAVCNNGVVDPGDLCVAAPISIWATPSPLVAVIAVDLNADGILDVAAATANRSFVRLGTGGAFGLWSSLTHVGVSFKDIAAGDFDADGDLDLAIADSINNRVLVRWNLGGVNFSAGTPYPVGMQPTRVMAARLNADARADFVVLNDGSNTATVRLAVAGGFAAGVNYTVGDTDDIAIGDCDANGAQDLLYYNGQGTSTQLIARRNNGAGGLAAPLGSSLPLFDPIVGYMEPLAIAAGDLDGDGRADAAVAASQSRLAPATSNGNCTFTASPYGLTWAWSHRIRAVDFDVNGDLDIAAPHGIAPNFSIAFGDGAGNILPYAQTLLPNPGARDIAFGDWNGDGFGDVIVAADAGLFYQRGTP